MATGTIKISVFDGTDTVTSTLDVDLHDDAFETFIHLLEYVKKMIEES